MSSARDGIAADEAGAPATPPPAAIPLRPEVQIVAAACALSSGAALVLAIVTDRPLRLWASVVGVPAFIALLALSVTARRDDQWLFLARLRAGFVGGALATAVYDLSRSGIEWLGWTSTHSLAALPVFGAGLTGLDQASVAARAAGWGFHIVNGIGFAVAFTMVAAGRPWPWAVLWGLCLEGFMIALYPSLLGVTFTQELLSVSITGHVLYGLVLGGFATRCP